MYNPENKHVILKNSFGVSYHVYYELGRGLCVRMLGDDAIWSRGYILSELSINDFSVILDRDDIFHFIFQATDGRIMYGHGRHGQIEVQPILNSRDTTPWPKHVSLLPCGNTILFFYIVRVQKRHLLSMQSYKDGVLSKPAAIDYVDGSGIKYQALIDFKGKCHLFYTSQEGTINRLYRRIFNDKLSVFSAPEKMHSTKQDILLWCAVCSGDQIHLQYQISSENVWQVLFRKVDPGKDDICLYQGGSPPGYTGLVGIAGTIWFFRVTSESIYARSSADSGKTWGDETFYPFGTVNAITCFTYFTNNAKERMNFSCHELPGNFSHGYQLAFFNKETAAGFLQGSSAGPSGIRLPGGRDEISGSNSPKMQVSDNEKGNSVPSQNVLKDMQKNVLQLKNNTENMQHELTKLWLMQKDYEKRMDLLSRSLKKMKEKFEAGLQDENDENEEDIKKNVASPNTIVPLKSHKSQTNSNMEPKATRFSPDDMNRNKMKIDEYGDTAVQPDDSGWISVVNDNDGWISVINDDDNDMAVVSDKNDDIAAYVKDDDVTGEYSDNNDAASGSDEDNDASEMSDKD